MSWGLSMSGETGTLLGQDKLFFFEKNNQKTFDRLTPSSGERSAQRNESFFASFFTKKEVLACLTASP